MKLNRLVYVIAGEASGDAIGAKLICAMKKHGPFEFRGVGGRQMTQAGGFTSLFPMEELSVMGLVEVIPKMFLMKRRIRDVVQDIGKHQPHAIVTIDSKGFCFRVLNTIKDGNLRQNTAVVHYVAPSIWAYRHKNKKAASTSNSLQHLMDRMLVILPFELPLFSTTKKDWVTFVGHPAVEEFLETNMLLRSHSIEDNQLKLIQETLQPNINNEWINTTPALDALAAQTNIFHQARTNAALRVQNVEQIYKICALVGSRENEVLKTVDIVRSAIDAFSRTTKINLQVVFPTIPSLEPIIRDHLKDWSVQWSTQVDDAAKKTAIQTSDVAVAMSGTVVIESALLGTPTIVIYKANRLTEVIAKALARVNFVSIPNIMMERELIPELIFTQCTSSNIADALSQKLTTTNDVCDEILLSCTLSQLAQWTSDGTSVTPQKASEIAAEAIVNEMDKKLKL